VLEVEYCDFDDPVDQGVLRTYALRPPASRA
jgi:hypothetical protein